MPIPFERKNAAAKGWKNKINPTCRHDSCSPYRCVQTTIRARSDSLPLLTELRSEALKDRHWRPLLRRVGVRVTFVELNLGLLWGSDLSGHRKIIGETVQAAQGEMALEEFLRQVCSSLECMP